jgi:sec-independent protein translocase protein TatC
VVRSGGLPLWGRGGSLPPAKQAFYTPLLFARALLLTTTTTTTTSLLFSYEILTPAALNFFVSYAEGAVESLWSIDQYFQFVLVLMLSTGLSFQVGAGWMVGAVRRGGTVEP